jgi:uncharacterized protein YtpQ (UPF0354 family)
MVDREAEIAEVLEQLRRGPHNRDSIALLTTKLIELRNAAFRTELASESEIRIIWPDGKSNSMFLNLWSECEKSPDERAEIVDRYVRVLVPELEESEAMSSTKDLVVLVRDVEYSNLVPAEDRDFVTDHIVGDLWTILGVDSPESINTLTARKLAPFALDKRELIKVGLENVEQMLGQMQFSPYGECFTLSCESIDYASTALLLDYVWEQAANLIEGDLILAVPARDTVLFTGSANVKGLQQLRDEVQYVFTTGHHLISETLFKRLNRGWKLFS